MQEPFVKVSLSDYSDMLENRFVYAQNWWGSEGTESLWYLVKDLILESAPYMDSDKTSPHYLVDNYVVNSEIVSREEFEDENYYISNRDKYETFEEYAENEATLWNEDFALINLGC